MKTAVLLLYYRQLSYVQDCIDSLLIQNHPDLTIVFIDNHSGDGGVEYVRSHFPQVITHSQSSNDGYAKTYNHYLKLYFDKGYDACVIMNVDTAASPSLITELEQTYLTPRSSDAKIGLIQPVVKLMQHPEKINTIGNAIHWSGIGYCPDYMKSIARIPTDDEPIMSVSGCCMYVTRDYFTHVGPLNERYFMYMEDQDYSVRGTKKGYTHYLSSKAEILHDYTLKFSFKKVFLLLKGLWTYHTTSWA